ncbi:MAG TPA: AmmeMemoRadiSam system radical SAM enzyme [Desulfobacteraceae bacterium]|nr:AmmeMemoRadiSam system radical SAM enzyme [Desulfobacteraceae bacterium]
MEVMLSRKEFIKTVFLSLSSLLIPKIALPLTEKCKGSIRGTIFKGGAPKRLWRWSKEAYFYRSNGREVQCLTCPNYCILAPGDRSICRSKVNIGGKLYSIAYGNPCAIHIDPIEKKPLFHFYPSTYILSIATAGCNFRCLGCQNWEISQRRPEDLQNYDLFPEEVVKLALKKDVPSIAYTYSEAITFYEYMFDTAYEAHKKGLKNVAVSNGYINERPLRKLIPYLDGANIDLKSFENSLYECLNGGSIYPVLRTLKILKREGVWLEVATLVVPGYVDNPEMIKRMCDWILKELGPDCPLHFLRFFPRYKLTRLPPTPIKVLENFRDIALREGLHYVYIGNVPGHPATHTYCPSCKRPLIKRFGYLIKDMDMVNGRCRYCGEKIAGRWE